MRRQVLSSIFTLAIVGTTSLYVGCVSNAQSGKGAPGGAGQAPPPPVVEVIEAKQADVPVFSEFPAQTYARNQVDVRGRVTGYVEKWLFKPGAVVKAGQPLYVLDLRPYRAAVQQAQGNVQQQEADVDFARRQVSLLQAEANLAASEANLVKSQQDFQRFKPLVEQDAAARRDLEAAEAALRAAEASVRANKANVEQTRLQTQTQIQGNVGKLESLRGALETANLNLEYGTIKAPISGVIGDTTVAVGGLVNPSSATPLTTIVPLDPIWVRLQMSETQFLAYDRRKSSGDRAPLTLVLADNTEFPQKGRIENTTNQVDPRTGTLELQASFPNPGGRLLPGQFGRVQFQTAQRQNVIVVPQRAVQQQQNIQAVMTVGPDSKVQVRAVKTAERVGDGWVIEQGIQPGDKVIVEGQLRVRPGIQVTTRPFKGK